jgi:hypothetical protein
VSKIVLYYNAETKRVLTSCNYHFLMARNPEPLDEIIIIDSPTHKGKQEEELRIEEETRE